MLNLTLLEKTAETSGSGLIGLLPMIVIYGLLFFALWFFIIRPRRKSKRKNRKCVKISR